MGKTKQQLTCLTDLALLGCRLLLNFSPFPAISDFVIHIFLAEETLQSLYEDRLFHIMPGSAGTTGCMSSADFRIGISIIDGRFNERVTNRAARQLRRPHGKLQPSENARCIGMKESWNSYLNVDCRILRDFRKCHISRDFLTRY